MTATYRRSSLGRSTTPRTDGPQAWRIALENNSAITRAAASAVSSVRPHVAHAVRTNPRARGAVCSARGWVSLYPGCPVARGLITVIVMDHALVRGRADITQALELPVEGRALRWQPVNGHCVEWDHRTCSTRIRICAQRVRVGARCCADS